MTWNTPAGNRVLKGAEAELVQCGLGILMDELRDTLDSETGETSEYGYELFDRLPYPSKIALLAEVGHALLKRTRECPEVTAYRQATVATIYAVVTEEIESEVRHGDEPLEGRTLATDHYRSRLIEALTRLEGEPPEMPGKGDLEHWRMLVEVAEEYVLHDLDHLMADLFLDAEPAIAAEFKEGFGILPDFFTAIAPDPNEKELKKALRILDTLSK